MRSSKELYWTATRQAHLEEARRVLGTQSDSETVARALEIIAIRGVPPVDAEKIRVKAQTQGLYIVSYDHRAVGRIINRDMKGRWYLTVPMDEPKDFGEVTNILHRDADLKAFIARALA